MDELVSIDDRFVSTFQSLSNATNDSSMLVVLNQIETIYTEALNTSPPSGFSAVYEHFLNGAMWYTLAANAFEMAIIWNQSHWIETGGERLDTASDFMDLADDEVGSICFG